jgi:hypothetical protein
MSALVTEATQPDMSTVACWNNNFGNCSGRSSGIGVVWTSPLLFVKGESLSYQLFIVFKQFTIILQAKIELAVATRPMDSQEGMLSSEIPEIPSSPVVSSASCSTEQNRFDALLSVLTQVTSTQLVLAEDRRETIRMLSQSRSSLVASEFAPSRPATPVSFAGLGRNRRRHSSVTGEAFEMAPLHITVPRPPVIPPRTSSSTKGILKPVGTVAAGVPPEGAGMASSEDSLPPPPESLVTNGATQHVRTAGNCAMRLRTSPPFRQGTAGTNVTFSTAPMVPAVVPRQFIIINY